MTHVASLPSFDPTTFAERVHRFFSPTYARHKAMEFVEQLIAKFNPDGGNAPLIDLADHFIHTYKESKILGKIAQILDRAIGRLPLREKGADRYLHAANKEGFQKWVSYGMPADVYIRFPEFCNWMERSRLLSQMKISPHPARDTIHMVLDEPALLVTLERGRPPQLMKWSRFRETFAFIEKKEFNEIFIYRKGRTSEYIPGQPPQPTVYTYLPNGSGLQPYHPYHAGKKPGEKRVPTTRLSKAEYSRTLETARAFIRTEESAFTPEEQREANKKRTFILQVVTPYVKVGNTNLHEMIKNRRHPYLRIISGKSRKGLKTQKRDVYEIGYWWRKSPGRPFIAHQGRFRSPDKWSYLPQDEVVVANFAITEEEAQRVFKFTENYHRDHSHDTGFQILYQNCTTYARQACQVAGIDLPTLIDKKVVLFRMLPDWIQAAGRALATAIRATGRCCYRAYSLLPSCITSPLTALAKIITHLGTSIIDWGLSLTVLPLRLAAGEGQGEGGRQFDPINALADAPAEEERIDPPLRRLRRWFTFWSEPIDMPATVPDFTRPLPSTIVFPKKENPRLSIATPAEGA